MHLTGTINQDETNDTLENQKEESMEISDNNDIKLKQESKPVIEENTTISKVEVSINNI